MNSEDLVRDIMESTGGWVIAAVLVFVIHYLSKIADQLLEIQKNLTRLNAKYENVEERIVKIEGKVDDLYHAHIKGSSRIL